MVRGGPPSRWKPVVQDSRKIDGQLAPHTWKSLSDNLLLPAREGSDCTGIVMYIMSSFLNLVPVCKYRKCVSWKQDTAARKSRTLRKVLNCKDPRDFVNVENDYLTCEFNEASAWGDHGRSLSGSTLIWADFRDTGSGPWVLIHMHSVYPVPQSWAGDD